MVVGYSLSFPDNKSHMFPDDSGLEKCPKCGYRLDFFAHNPKYRLRSDQYDLGATYDGQLIASQGFKRFCEKEGYTGIRFLEFERDEVHFHVILENIVPFDAQRRGTVFENRCSVCNNYESVIGATPALLKTNQPLKDGVFRSDLLFASANEKCPLELVGLDTKAKMVEARLRGLHFEEAMGSGEE